MNLEEVKTYKMGKKHRGDPGMGDGDQDPAKTWQ